MVTLSRPGVYVDESAFPTYVSSTPGTASAAFVGWTPRGPVDPATGYGKPTIVTSWKDFTAKYGGFEKQFPPSDLHLAVYCYFSAGGTAAVIVRTLPVQTAESKATVATVTFADSNTSGVQPTLQVNAISPGAWGDNIWIDILNGKADPATGVINTFYLRVKYQGSSPINQVEQWGPMTMDPTGATVGGTQNAEYAPDVINSSFTGSHYINVVDVGKQNSTPTPPPQNIPAATSQSTPLVNGTDGAAITFQDQQIALQQLDKYPDQPFVINMPGLATGGPPNFTDIGNVIAYAQNRGDGFVVLDCPQGYGPSDMVNTFVNNIPASAQAAVYYPQVIIADPYSPVQGRTRLVPPGGFVVGLYMATDHNRGVAKAPAGLGTTLLGAYGLETTLTNDDQGLLTQSNVNCIISVPGSGVVLWGARTLSPYLVTRYVSVERSLIYLSTQMVAMTKFAVFEPNDWILWNSIGSVLNQFLMAFWQSGGLSGTSASEAYYIICDNTNNTPQSIQQGIVNVEVGVALEYPAEFVVIKIGQWAGGQSTSITS